ncbi:glycosyltransferase family 4 protein [uncultured Bacteroides sp.]|uniref:glycosyltransferase family 4 protein n=1 Tax=uncultured Bacteroides sp. TaxID=162156 RepID=UPI002AA91B9D|nr:glycosyltransferase family 4 protein [uncultured Bacteroides sp.]
MATKLLYIIGGVWNGTGMERVLITKANYMSSIGYDVYILLTEDGKGTPFFEISPKIQICNVYLNFDHLDNYPIYKKIPAYIIKQKKYKKELTKILFQIKPDITISALRREINFINEINDGSKKVGEFHFSKVNYRTINKKYLPSFINKMISKRWMNQLIKEIKKLSSFVVLTNEDKENWNELDNVQVICNPLSFFTEKTSSCINKKIITVGSYNYVKGYDRLIDAWEIVAKKHPDWELHIYGGGNRDNFIKKIQEKKLETSFFCHKAENNIQDKYIESSIFVLSSRYEGMPMVLLEAMSCGLPPVSFACPCGPRDIIQNQIDGLLVENGNIQELADKICYLIENENIRKEMGEKARTNIERYKIENIGLQWIALFDKLINKE